MDAKDLRIVVIASTAYRSRRYAQALYSAGYLQVRALTQQQAARMNFRHEQPDLAIVESCLGHTNGYEIAEELRSLGSGEFCVPIILIASGGDAALHARCVRAAALLERPFELHELVTCVDSLDLCHLPV